MAQRIEGIDDELRFFINFGEAANEQGVCWRICHQPILFPDDGMVYEGISAKFGRKSDAEAALKAIVAAGLTTARKMWSDLDERKRIVAEAMAW